MESVQRGHCTLRYRGHLKFGQDKEYGRENKRSRNIVGREEGRWMWTVVNEEKIMMVVVSTQPCISQVKSWMTVNKLKLNENNSDQTPKIHFVLAFTS